MSSSTGATSRELLNAHNGTIKITNKNYSILPMEPVPFITSTTNFAYNPTKKKKFQFVFYNSVIRGEFEFHHSYELVRAARKNYFCKNAYFINDTDQKINLSYNALAPHNYQHIIFSKDHPMEEIFKTSFHKEELEGRDHPMYTIIGFAHALSSENISKLFAHAYHSINEKELSQHYGGTLVYGFKDGTFFRVEDKIAFNSNSLAYSLKIEKHKFTNIQSIKDLEVNTKRILSEMIDYYRSMNSINNETKIFLAQNLLFKLQRIIKIVKYYEIDLGYTNKSIARKVLEPLKTQITNNSIDCLKEKNSINNSQPESTQKVNFDHPNTPMLKPNGSVTTAAKNDSTDLLEKSAMQETTISNIIDPRSLEIIKEFRSYSSDLVKMMNRPILVNSSDMRVKDFNLICLKLEDNANDISYYELLNGLCYFLMRICRKRQFLIINRNRILKMLKQC